MASGSARRPTRAEIERAAEQLQDRGMVDLDAPLRDAIPMIARNMAHHSMVAASWWIIASGENPHAVCECNSD